MPISSDGKGISMYLIKSTIFLQGKLIIKLTSLESGEDFTLSVAKEFLPPFVSADTANKEIDDEEFEALFEMSELTRAAEKALNALSYGALSKKALVMKLVAKYKIDKEYAEAAADYAEKHRYIDEAEQAERIAKLSVRNKRYGKRKVMAYLVSKGYGKETAQKAADSVAEEEYEEAAFSSLFKKAKSYPETKEEKYKLINALLRQGHGKSHIEKAFERLSDI